MLIMGAVAWLAVELTSLHTAFGFAQMNYGFAYVLMGIGLSMIQPLIGLATNAYSRYCEFRADRQAVAEGYGPALISGLKNLSRADFAHLAPAKLNVVLEYSHPPMSQRVEAIEKAMKN
jgi:STE24 endopeptidase